MSYAAALRAEATAAISEVEQLEIDWTNSIMSSNRGNPKGVIDFLKQYLHEAYLKIGLQKTLDKPQELTAYPDWLMTVKGLTSPVMASQYLGPDCVVVRGVDVLLTSDKISSDKIFRCVWRDTWLYIKEEWRCLEAHEVSVVDMPVVVPSDGDYQTLLAKYIN